MNFERLLNKIHQSAKNRLERSCGMKLTSDPDFVIDLKRDQANTILQLRNKIHHMNIELMELRFRLQDNERLQRKNKGVRNAWEQYQIMLRLAKDEK